MFRKDISSYVLPFVQFYTSYLLGYFEKGEDISLGNIFKLANIYTYTHLN